MARYRGRIRSLAWWNLKRGIIVSGKYEVQTFLAMFGLVVSNYVRGLPSLPYLYPIAVSLLVLIATVGFLLRHHPKLQTDFTKVILGGAAWTSATIASVVFLPFPLDFTKFFGFSNSIPQNLILGVAFLFELALPGLWFRMSDLLKDQAVSTTTRLRRMESTIDWDAIIRAEEFS